MLGFFPVCEVLLVLAKGALSFFRVGLDFWTFAEHRNDNIKTFLLSKACPKLRPFLSSPPAGEDTGVCGRLGGDTYRTGDPKGPKGYSRPCGTRLRI